MFASHKGMQSNFETGFRGFKARESNITQLLHWQNTLQAQFNPIFHILLRLLSAQHPPRE